MCSCQDKIKKLEKNLAILHSLFVECNSTIHGDLQVGSNLLVKGNIYDTNSNALSNQSSITTCTINNLNRTINLNIPSSSPCRRILVDSNLTCISNNNPAFTVLIGSNTPLGLYQVENNSNCTGQVLDVTIEGNLPIPPGPFNFNIYSN